MSNRRGFGIIEVMVSVAIVVTVSGALFAVSRNATRTILMTQDQIAAANLAQGLLEQARGIRDKAPDLLANQNNFQTALNTVDLNPVTTQRTVTVNNVPFGYTLSADACVVGNTGNATLPTIGNNCTVKATITWAHPQLGAQKYEAEELLTDWE